MDPQQVEQGKEEIAQEVCNRSFVISVQSRFVFAVQAWFVCCCVNPMHAQLQIVRHAFAQMPALLIELIM